MTTLIHREQAFYEDILINTHTEDDYADPQRAGILWTPSYKHTQGGNMERRAHQRKFHIGV